MKSILYKLSQLIIFCFLLPQVVAQSMPFPGPGMPAGAASSPALVSRLSAGSIDANTFTTGSVDTSGANALFVVYTYYIPAGAPTLTENKGNGAPTGTLTAYLGSSSNLATRIAYWTNPTTGSGHTFTLTCTGCAPALSVFAFSGMVTSSMFQAGTDVGNTTNAADGNTTCQPNASISPTGSTVVITGVGADASATYTVDSSVTHSGSAGTDYTNYVGSQHFGVAGGYRIMPSGGAIQPIWTASATTNKACAIAAFTGN